MPPIIQCEKLTKRFGNFTAVQDLDLELEPGTVLGFLGPNGAGKSTTIRMMLGLSMPSSGTVRLFGEDPLRNRAARTRVGYSPGELRLDDRLTVAATLKSWARLRGGVDEAFRDSLIDRLGVQMGRHVRGLSTGNRRKLALVGALMSRPELLILDEPSIPMGSECRTASVYRRNRDTGAFRCLQQRRSGALRHHTATALEGRTH